MILSTAVLLALLGIVLTLVSGLTGRAPLWVGVLLLGLSVLVLAAGVR